MRKVNVFLISLLLVSMPLTGVFLPVINVASQFPSQELAPNLLSPAGISHAHIVINGDANFSDTALNEGWIGNGSSTNPFIIDGLDIDLGGGAGHCINISDTRANFTIQNCNLTGAISGAGIFLENVSFGYLFNNTCTFNAHGIYLLQSTYNTIENNTCLANSRGISMYQSDFNTVTGNDCDDNNNYGILLQLCDFNIIFNNLCSSTGAIGIDGQSVVSNTFANNTCNQNSHGIRVWDYSSGNTIANNTCNSNSNYGIILYNYDYAPSYITNNYCSDNDYGINPSGSYLFVLNNILIDNLIYGIETQCYESVISQNTILRSDRGLHFHFVHYSIVSQNEISGSSIGIFMMESQENMISENSILANYEAGISIEEHSHENTVFLNDISIDTTWDPFEFWGIRIDSSSDSNNLTMNYLLFEHHIDCVGIEDNGDYNLIDRNWYEDYSDEDYDEDGYWDTPYSIPGSAGNSDLRPLVYHPRAPEWTELPTDQIIDFWGQSFYYDLNASAPSPITWSVNDTIQFSIDSNGVLLTLSDLPVDSYGIRVRVTNIYGLYLTGTFRLTVQEVSLPEWIVGPTDLILSEGDRINVGLIVTDESGISGWSINNTVEFSLNVQHLNVTGYNFGWYLLQITNATVLLVGEYPLIVSVIDPYGNMLSGVFTVTISIEATDNIAPVWISTPTAQVLSYGTPLALQLVAWDASGISYGWVNNTDHFTIDESWVLRNTSVIESGIYRLEVRMYDMFDNFCSANFTVTILDVPPTTTPTTTSPTTTTPSSPPTTTTQISTPPTTPTDGLFPMMAFALGLGIGGGIVVVAVLLILRKSDSTVK